MMRKVLDLWRVIFGAFGRVGGAGGNEVCLLPGAPKALAKDPVLVPQPCWMIPCTLAWAGQQGALLTRAKTPQQRSMETAESGFTGATTQTCEGRGCVTVA